MLINYKLLLQATIAQVNVKACTFVVDERQSFFNLFKVLTIVQLWEIYL